MWALATWGIKAVTQRGYAMWGRGGRGRDLITNGPCDFLGWWSIHFQNYKLDGLGRQLRLFL